MVEKAHRIQNEFDEFSSVSRREWLSAIANYQSDTDVASDQVDQSIAFSAINTDEQLPPLGDKINLIQETFSVIEVAMSQLPDREILRSLVLLGVNGLYLPDRHLAKAVSLLSEFDHPFNLLSVEVSELALGVVPYLRYLRDMVGNNHPVRGTVYHPVTRWSQWQKGNPDIKSLVKLMNEVSDLPTVRVLAVSGDAFHAMGASVVDELAMTLSWWVAYCDQLTDLGVTMEEVLTRTEITLATGAGFFLDLAKFRAMRFLIDKVKDAYIPEVDDSGQPLLRTVSGMRNKTFYDPDSNILRNTTEALAARLGGVDTLSLQSHDFLYPPSGDFGERIAIQGNNILHHEAHIGKVYDPAAGSYFVEDITRQLVEKSWGVFLCFENQGGFQKLVSDGTLTSRCQQHLKTQVDQVARQKRVLVGATRYTNALESAAIPYDDVPPRLAAAFEQIRNTIDQQLARGEARPIVLLWIQQDSSSVTVINQRVNYVKDLLTSVGFAYEEYLFTTVERYESAEVPNIHPAGVIFCGTDSFYKSEVAFLFKTDHQSSVCWYVAGGSPAVEESVGQAGGGVVGIGRDVISILEQMIKPTQYEA